jgi:hypothetical protein
MKSFRKHQDGFAHILIAVVVLVVAAAAGFAVWKFVLNKNDEPAVLKNASAEVTAAETACMTKYNDQDLCTFIAVQTASPFDKAATVITMAGTDSAGAASNIVMQSDGNGNSKTIMTGDGTTYNAITLNDISYYQTETDGPWITYGADTTSDTATTEDSGLTSFIDSMDTTTYTKLAKEACGNLTCFKYQVIDTEQTGTLYAWFDTEDYLLRQFYQSDDSGSFTMTITYQAVTIPTPSPVEDMSDIYSQT